MMHLEMILTLYIPNEKFQFEGRTLSARALGLFIWQPDTASKSNCIFDYVYYIIEDECYIKV